MIDSVPSIRVSAAESNQRARNEPMLVSSHAADAASLPLQAKRIT